MAYQPTQFQEGGPPGLSAAEMNKLGSQYGEVKSELQKTDGTSDIRPHGSNIADGSVTLAKVDPSGATRYTARGSANGWFTLANITGAGILLAAMAMGHSSTGQGAYLRVTVDGGQPITFPSVVAAFLTVSGGRTVYLGTSLLPPIRFQSSLLVEFKVEVMVNGDEGAATALVKLL